MQIKEIFKTAMEKTKSVLKRLLGFLNAKRFSIVTLLLSLILCLDLYSCLVPYNARGPTTASASNITNLETDTVIVCPSVRCNVVRPSQIVDYCEIPTMFIPYLRNSTTFLDVYHLSFSNENVNGEYYPIPLVPYEGYFANCDGVLLSNWYVSDVFSYQFLFVRDSVDGELDFNAFSYLETVRLYIEVNAPRGEFITTPNNCVFRYNPDYGYYSNGTSVSYFGSYSMLRWEFYFDNDFLFALSLSHPRGVSNFLTDSFKFRYITISPELIGNTQYYYDLGYNEGYYQGLLVDREEISPFKMVADAIDSFLDIELFGTLAIKNIVQIGFGIILLGFIIKIFLGG